MAGTECIELALGTFRETAEPPVLAQSGELISASGQEFVRIGLVAHIKYESVVRSIEYVMQGDCEFHYAEIWSEVSAIGGNRGYDQIADFLRQFLKLLNGQISNLARGFDLGKKVLSSRFLFQFKTLSFLNLAT